MSDSPISEYLSAVRRSVPWYLPRRRRFLRELADHLDQAAAVERAAGLSEHDARSWAPSIS